ncbi:IS1634 family transposase [Butyrivibrio sp. INlla14]|uniref:IS1634 family transposase n=1 Tax=Butyrivibrio sp. INlla14 TaxID=1520808 RepID=UPI000876CB40|nr:IS1634 family transposase [Butyrivibrio sp. INlla14]SCY65653.1 Transposase DDE domain-containing protein [Butyrivibrio sp. INlla14]SCY72519.1 Transposase DDE domain-containing protein [Butyrivibrio sp. INlla14]SCY73081.1 transposase, IS4 family [Butyrivibrio sp. INlla14]SCY75427.1 Transposase DDE domain-containing protein [Butyrivibrio sp. INlla14]
MAIITQTDKRSGITYAYETTYYWDKEKQQSRSKRVCIGKVDPVSGEIIPTRGRAKKGESKTPKALPARTGPVTYTETKHLYFGATYLLEQFADQIGLTADLKQCFPDMYKKLLSVAFYLVLEDNNPLYRFEKWNLTHKHPYGQDIASPRSSEMFASITDDQIAKFLRLQAKRRVEDEYWAYDSSSFSSYSETLKQAQWGKNKENDRLPQINLLLVFGEKSGLPFYYRKLAGNIPDSKTVKHLLEDLDILGFGKTKFVMDRGFYSEDNINGLYREHVKFLVGVKLSLKLIKKNLDEVYDDIRMFNNFDEGLNTYGLTVSAEWNYTQDRPYKGDTIEEKRRIYIHYFYSIERGADEEQAFDKRIMDYCNELLSGKPVEDHKKAYARFFEVKDTPVRGRQVYYKEDEIKAARKYIGYFAIITNEKMDAFTALHLYRMKDVVEKAFGNLKERLNMRRLLTKSEKNLDGKIFNEFIALILISHLDHKMKETDLYKTYTMQQLLDKLDVLECYEDEKRALRIGELLDKQADIYTTLGVALPTSSC